jgi:hypothetical protein
METLRLRRLQQAPHAERLFGALVVRSGLLPQGAYQIRDPGSVPKELRRIAKLAANSGCTWSCWALGSRIWLITGELLLPLSRKRGAPVLQVDVFDEEGPKDSDLWMPDPDGKWNRYHE